MKMQQGTTNKTRPSNKNDVGDVLIKLNVSMQEIEFNHAIRIT